MEENLNKSKTGVIIAFVVAVLLVGGGALAYWLTTRSSDDASNNTVANVTNSATNQTTTNTTQTREVPSGMKLYEKKDFGFSLYYPLSYDSNKDYSVWTANIQDSQNNFGFGINKFQETIFSITAYKKVEETDKIASLKTHVVSTTQLSNGLTASILASSQPEHYLIEKNNFVYTISSTYADKSAANQSDLNNPGWNEFDAILNSLVLEN